MKRSLEAEMMDPPDKPRDLYLEDLSNLRRFNRHLGGRRSLPLRIVALELDGIAAAEARERSRGYPEITVMRGDAACPPFHSAAFDVVIASQLLHHFSEEQILRMLHSWSRLARKAILVSDLVRHPLAYHAVRWISRAATANIMTRVDAPLSVQRSFTLPEWRELFRAAGVGPFRLSPLFPFRQVTLIGTGES